MERILLEWTGGETFALKDTPPCGELSAKQLMLLAMGKCSTATAMSLMTKMRLHVTGFTLETEGVLSEEEKHSTTVFRSFHQRFRIECIDEKEHERIMRAVELTLARYCGVSLMMEMIAPVSYELFINGKLAVMPETAALEE